MPVINTNAGVVQWISHSICTPVCRKRLFKVKLVTKNKQISRCNVTELFCAIAFIERLLPIISIQEYLRRLLQTVSPSKMLPITLCLDALFGHFAINQVQDASQKVTLHRPNSITKAIDGLLKYNGDRA